MLTPKNLNSYFPLYIVWLIHNLYMYDSDNIILSKQGCKIFFVNLYLILDVVRSMGSKKGDNIKSIVKRFKRADLYGRLNVINESDICVVNSVWFFDKVFIKTYLILPTTSSAGI